MRWLVFITANIVMLLIGIYKGFILLLAVLASGFDPRSAFDIAFLLEPPAYIACAATLWKWPWFSEMIAIFNLVVIFARFNPWTISPFRKSLLLDYVFIIAATVAFFAVMSRRKAAMKIV